MKSTLPVIIAFVVGLLMVITFFTPEDGTFMGEVRAQILIWGTIIGGFTLVLGVASLWRINQKVVSLKKPGWGYNVLTLIGVLIMAIPSLLPVSWSTLFGDSTGSIYDWFFTYVTTPMTATMFSILAFYIASAAYRAFRARTVEAALLLITACLVMLWRIPMGEAFLRLFSDALPDAINQYIMNGINLSVQRGIVMGAALGAAANSLRILLGIERTYMGPGRS